MKGGKEKSDWEKRRASVMRRRGERVSVIGKRGRRRRKSKGTKTERGDMRRGEIRGIGCNIP